METKTIEIKVPKCFSIPHYLQIASPEQTEHALKLADAISYPSLRRNNTNRK